jgi:hypothetical protein
MRPENATLVDRFELSFPIIEPRAPAIERYRAAPIQSLYLEIDFEDTDTGETSSPGSDAAYGADGEPKSDRYLRARCWASEE